MTSLSAPRAPAGLSDFYRCANSQKKCHRHLLPLGNINDINRELEVVARAFALAQESDRLSFAPTVPSLREDNARQGFFETPDFYAVLSHIADTDLRDFLEWSFWSGMRPGETKSLTWEAFDKETYSLRLHAKDAKTGYGRVIPLEA